MQGSVWTSPLAKSTGPVSLLLEGARWQPQLSPWAFFRLKRRSFPAQTKEDSSSLPPVRDILLDLIFNILCSTAKTFTYCSPCSAPSGFSWPQAGGPRERWCHFICSEEGTSAWKDLRDGCTQRPCC